MKREVIKAKMNKLALDNNLDWSKERQQKELEKLSATCIRNNIDFDGIADILYMDGGFRVLFARDYNEVLQKTEEFLVQCKGNLTPDDVKMYKYQRNDILDTMHNLHLEIEQLKAKDGCKFEILDNELIMKQYQREVDLYEFLMQPAV